MYFTQVIPAEHIEYNKDKTGMIDSQVIYVFKNTVNMKLTMVQINAWFNSLMVILHTTRGTCPISFHKYIPFTIL